MKNTRKILFSAALLSSGLTMAQTTTAEKSPNVIYIMADDLGIGDLGCYGQRQIKTPNIDGIAQNGMKFMQHYSGSTVSAPSRCALITGKHMGHAAIRGNAKVAGSDGLLYETPLPVGEVTVADIFKTKNYVTGCVGKWGMGGPGTEGMPGKHGFDYFYGYLGQRFAHSYYPEFLHENEQKIMLDGKYYSHDLMLEKALNFIDENAQKPFFLYFSPTIPHADLDIMGEAMTEYEGEFCETPFGGSRDGYKSQQNPRAAYAAMVTYLDKSVGLIIKELKEKGLYDHTIIVFTSDNGVHSEGGHDPSYFDSNGPFRGQKRDLYEGGIRTPFVIQWPGVIPQGVVTNHISAFWDFLPTIGELVQADIPQNIDGISYLPTLTGKGTQKEHDCIYYEFFEFGGKQSIMTPDGWKLVRLEVSDSSKTYEELYNIYTDPAECTRVRHEVAIPIFDKRDERLDTLTDESVDVYYSCILCQAFSPSHVCVVTPERLGLCGAVSWLDAKATHELDPNGPCQVITKERPIDENLGSYEDVDEAVKKFIPGCIRARYTVLYHAGSYDIMRMLRVYLRYRAILQWCCYR